MQPAATTAQGSRQVEQIIEQRGERQQGERTGNGQSRRPSELQPPPPARLTSHERPKLHQIRRDGGH